MSVNLTLPLEFFPMNGHDVAAVAALEASVQPFPWSERLFSDSLTAGDMACVCRIGGELLGFSIVMIVLDEAQLLNIAVGKSFQGKGLGARMLRQAMDEAQRRGATRMLLEVRPSNARAVRLYELFGFRRIGVRRAYYPAADGREDGLVYEKELA